MNDTKSKDQKENNLMVRRIKDIPFASGNIKFAWDGKARDFAKYNIIYGRNGSGKSTIANMFADIESAERKKQLELNSKFNPREQTTKVFSRDYIKDHLHFEKIGETDDDSEGIDKVTMRIEVNPKLSELQNRSKKIKGCIDEDQKQIDEDTYRFFKNATSYLVTKFGSDKVGQNRFSIRHYDQGNLKSYIKEIGESKTSTTNNRDLAENVAEIEKLYKEIQDLAREKNNERIKQEPIVISEADIKNQISKRLESNLVKVKQLLGTVVTGKILDDLKENPKFNSWVKEGYDMYREKKMYDEENSMDICLFCKKGIKKEDERMLSLERHFSKSYSDLERKLQDIKLNISNSSIFEDIKTQLADIKLVDTCDACYVKVKDELLKDIGLYEKFCSDLVGKIDEKLKDIFSSPKTEEIKLPTSDLYKFIQVINKMIKRHNQKLSDAKDAEKDREETLKKIYLLIITTPMKSWDKDCDEKFDVSFYDKYHQMKENSESLRNMAPESRRIKLGLEEMMKQTDESLERLNEKLNLCFKNRRIEFTLAENKEFYTLERNKEPASGLSEAEKNIIALVYFFHSLEDEDIKNHKVSVILDDPVTSFDDENFHYAVTLISSIITGRGNNIVQSLILTHNIRLVEQMKFSLSHWDRECHYYEVRNNVDPEDKSQIEVLEMEEDKLKRISEYLYIFKQVLGFYKEFFDQSGNKIKDLKEHRMMMAANPLRRLLESIEYIFFPDSPSLKVTISKLLSMNTNKDKASKRIDNILEALEIVNTVNKGSHGVKADMTLDMRSSYRKIPDSIKDVMCALKKNFGDHYGGMINLCKKDNTGEYYDNNSKVDNGTEDASKSGPTTENSGGVPTSLNSKVPVPPKSALESEPYMINGVGNASKNSKMTSGLENEEDKIN